MADNDITSIRISATADTSSAQSDIQKLADSLQNLRNVSRQSFSKEFVDSLKHLTNAANSLDFSKKGITEALVTNVNNLANAVRNLTNVDDSKLKSIADSLKTIGKAGQAFKSSKRQTKTGGAEVNTEEKQLPALAQGDISYPPVPLKSLPAISTFRGNFEDIEKKSRIVEGTFREIDNTVTETSSKWEHLKNTLSSVGGVFSALAKKIKSVSSSLGSVSNKAKETEKSVKNIGKAASSSTSKFGQLWAAMKRIAVYRAIRSALKAITQAFREGISNMYQYSVLMDGTFKKSMDSLATSALYLKNSLGAMVAPLLNALAPAIDVLVDKFVDLLNVINQFIARITGASSWTKALKYPKEYADNLDRAGGAAKELKATLLGFDEINRLDDLKARGGGGGGSNLDYSQMFEEVELTKKTWSEMFEDLLESGKSKFSLWAAGLAGILSLKLAGGLTGIFGGTAGATSLMGGFTATMLAAFAGFSLGNWMYQNDIGGVKTVADDLMDAGLGEAITKLLGNLSKRWNNTIDGMILWGDKLWEWFDDINEGWGLLEDAAIKWGDKLWDAWDTAKQNWNLLWDKDTYTVLEPDMGNFAEGIIDAMAEAGLIFDKGKGTYTVDIDSQGKVNVYNAGGGHYYSPNYDPKPEPKPEPEPTPTVQIVIPNQSYIPAYLTKRAKGGSVETGDLFLANEKEPELIGHVGNKTQVANNDQITESIRVATAQGNAESNMLLREAVNLLGGILAKDNYSEVVVTADSVTNGLSRQNLRNGRTTVAVG